MWKRILMPVGQADDDHGHHGDEDEDFERGRDLADHLDAAHVDPGEDGDQRDRDEVVLPPIHPGEVVDEIVREKNGVGTAQKE